MPNPNKLDVSHRLFFFSFLALFFVTVDAIGQSTKQRSISSAPIDNITQARAIANAFHQIAMGTQGGVVHIRVSGGKLSSKRRKQIIERYKRQDPWYDLTLMADIERNLASVNLPPATGSGIIVESDGTILTNYHVVEQRTDITVVLPDDRQFKAELLGFDDRIDLALLHVDAKGLRPIMLGNCSHLKVGDWVIATGAPFGLTQTATHGIVSSLAREGVDGILDDYQQFIQIDAPIHPGNSGGPLLSIDGEVVGIITAQAPLSDAVTAGIGFAIPSNRAAHFIRELKETGSIRKSWLGVQMKDLTDLDAELFRVRLERGALVIAIYPQGPASAAGLNVEDVIISIDRNPIKNVNQLQNALVVKKPGQSTILGVMRDGKRKDINIKLAQEPDDLVSLPDKSYIRMRHIPPLGIKGNTLRKGLQMEKRFYYSPLGEKEEREVDVVGVRVTEAPANSGFKHWDVIVKCGTTPIQSVADLLEALHEYKQGEKVKLGIHGRKDDDCVGMEILKP